MAPVRGRDAIVGLHQELLEGGYKLHSMETEEIRISGDLAYVRQTIKSSDGTSIVMLIMHREPNGEWLVHAEAEVSPS